MSKEKPRNLAASVRHRLMDLARKQVEDFQLVLTRSVIERLLYRLCQSEHKNQFVLKGAMLFRLWADLPHRPTRDLDILGKGNSSLETLAQIFSDVCVHQVDDDGLGFDPTSVGAEPIKENQDYEGVRVTCRAHLGQARIDLQIDVGFGDAVVPREAEVSYPTILDFPAPVMKAYPMQVVVAEKFFDTQAIAVHVTNIVGSNSTHVYVDDDWANLLSGTPIADADPTVAGNQPATFGVNAFSVLQGGMEAVTANTPNYFPLTLFAGTYPEPAILETGIFVPAGTATVSGALSDFNPTYLRSALGKSGLGTLSLTAVNTYTGGTIINGGKLQVSSDAALGAPIVNDLNGLNGYGAVVVWGNGELNFTGSTTSSRVFVLNIFYSQGTLSIGTGATLTLDSSQISWGAIDGSNDGFINAGFFLYGNNGGQIIGGNVKGPGTIATTTGQTACFNGTTIWSSANVLANGSDVFTNLSSSGAVTIAAGQTQTFAGFKNEGAGRLTINGTVHASDFETYGRLTVNSGGSLLDDAGPLTFGTGSVTTINADNLNHANDGLIDFGAADAYVSGGLVNNYGKLGSSTNELVVDYLGRVQGSNGVFSTVRTQNGGVVSSGNSPGGASFSGFPFNGGGTFDFEISNATGTAGNVNGWDMATVAPTVFNPTSASIAITATAASKYTILIDGKLNDGVGQTAGAAANFNPAQNYAWKFLDGSHPATTVTGTFDPAAFNVVTTGFANAFTGTFSVELRDGGEELLRRLHRPGSRAHGHERDRVCRTDVGRQCRRHRRHEFHRSDGRQV